MKMKIYFHGYLGELVGPEVEVEAETVAEAVRGLELVPGFAREDGSPRSIKIDEVTSDIQLFAETNLSEINIRPIHGGGGGNNGFTQILLGVALVAVGLVLGPTAAILGGYLTGASLVTAGAMMALGGLLVMLAPTPEANTEEDGRYLGANGNTVQIGTRIPLLVGAARVPGHYLSFDTDAKTITDDTVGGTELVTELDTLEHQLTNGTGAYASGRFSYTVSNITGGYDWEPLTYTTIASGYINAANPYNLLSLLFYSDSAMVNRRVVYETKFVVAADDDCEFRFSNLTSGEKIEIIDTNGVVTPTGGVYSLVTTEIYTLRAVCDRTGFDYGGINEGTLEFKLSAAGTWTVFDNTTLVTAETPDPPPSVEITDSKYVVYDEPALADGITPVLPIFASPTPGPNNIPTSGWSV